MSPLAKILALSTAIFVSNAALAQHNPFYVAASLGIFKADFNNRYLDQTSFIPQNIVQPAIQHGYTGGVAVGYSKPYCGNYFLGAELSGNLENHNASFQSGASTAAFSDNLNVQGHADLTFMPGIKLSDTLTASLKLGVSVAWLEDTLTSPAGTIPVTTRSNSNESTFGFAGGLRLTKLVCSNVSIFTEADYHDYGSVDFPNFENFTATYTHSTHIYTYSVVVGAIYNF